ncbi:MAG TPA: hypothetical protein VHC44_03380 [Verrucomicrobiae bacterium]|nr:hypothetical protein [Verrucomicrobiae bacterium]
MTNNIQTEVSITRRSVELFIQANHEIEKRLGKAPGAEVLMALVLEKENPMEFVEDYCDILLQKAGSSSHETQTNNTP